MSDLNAEIKAAIDSFDMDRARELLRDALKEADAETYYLASKAAIDDDQKQEFLEKAVEADPFHEKARKALKSGTSNVEPQPDKSEAIKYAIVLQSTDLKIDTIKWVRSKLGLGLKEAKDLVESAPVTLFTVDTLSAAQDIVLSLQAIPATGNIETIDAATASSKFIDLTAKMLSVEESHESSVASDKVKSSETKSKSKQTEEMYQSVLKGFSKSRGTEVTMVSSNSSTIRFTQWSQAVSLVAVALSILFGIVGSIVAIIVIAAAQQKYNWKLTVEDDNQLAITSNGAVWKFSNYTEYFKTYKSITGSARDNVAYGTIAENALQVILIGIVSSIVWAFILQ